MKKEILNEIKRNLELMNISESKVFLNEDESIMDSESNFDTPTLDLDEASTPNLEPEIEAIFARLGVGANSIVNELKTLHPNENYLNSAEPALKKITTFASGSADRLAQVFELGISKGLIQSGELIKILETTSPNLTNEILRNFKNGADIDFIKQQFKSKMSRFPESVQNEYINSIEQTYKSGVDTKKSIWDKLTNKIQTQSNNTRYAPTQEDWDDMFIAMKTTNPDATDKQINLGIQAAKKIPQSATYDEFVQNGGLVASQRIQKALNVKWTDNKFFNSVKAHPYIWGTVFALSAPTLSSNAVGGAFGRAKTFIMNLLDKTGVLKELGYDYTPPKPNPNPNPNTYKNEEGDFKNFLITVSDLYKNAADKNVYKIAQQPDKIHWIVTTPTNKSVTYTYDKGTFTK